MSYPGSITSFTTKVDARQSIVDEAHTIPSTGPYIVALANVPYHESPSSVSIPGFSEVDVPPALDEFQVSYITGQVYFNVANAGQAILVSYKCLGDDVIANHINSLQAEFGIVENVIGLNPQGTHTSLRDRLSVSINDDGTLKGSTILPPQAGKDGKFLQTDGASASWEDVPGELPSQVGQAGKFLKTDGANPSWDVPVDDTKLPLDGSEDMTGILRHAGVQSVGGDARGTDAVDLQTFRSASSQVASGDHSVVGGGYRNTASGPYSVVAGGNTNVASNSNATVVGGASNVANQSSATVVGGHHNNAYYSDAVVVGGYYNGAGGSAAAVVGGRNNTIGNSSFAAILAGDYNSIGNADDRSVILGGSNCSITSTYCLVFGNQAQATSNGAVTLADSTAVNKTNSTSNSMLMSFVGGIRVENSDLEFTTIGKGPIIKSPNGSRFRLVVDDSGILGVEPL